MKHFLTGFLLTALWLPSVAWGQLSDFLVDSEDSDKVTFVGDWQASTYFSGFQGSNYFHDKRELPGRKQVTFTVPITVSGRYEIAFHTVGGYNRASNVLVEVSHAGGTASLLVDQTKKRGPVVINLGTYTYIKGDQAQVTIKNTDANGYVIVDALGFSMAEQLPEKNVFLVDNFRGRNNGSRLLGIEYVGETQTAVMTTLAELPYDRMSAAASLFGDLVYLIELPRRKNPAHLATYSTYTGEVTEIGEVTFQGKPLKGIVQAAMAPSGQLYVATCGRDDAVYTVDTRSGVATSLGQIGYERGSHLNIRGGDMAFSADGSWYMLVNGRKNAITPRGIYEITPSDAGLTATLINPNTRNGAKGLVIAENGNFQYNQGRVQIIETSASSGVEVARYKTLMDRNSYRFHHGDMAAGLLDAHKPTPADIVPAEPGESYCIDFNNYAQGQSAEIPNAIYPGLTISTSGGLGVVAYQGGIISTYISTNKDKTPLGCLDVGLLDARKKVNRDNQFTFEFTEDPVSNFSLKLADYGDYNPGKATSHYAALVAYDAFGREIMRDEISHTTKKPTPAPTPAQRSLNLSTNRKTLGAAGDYCLAQEGEPGNYTFTVRGDAIAKVELVFENNSGGIYGGARSSDPNIAIAAICFTTKAAPTCQEGNIVYAASSAFNTDQVSRYSANHSIWLRDFFCDGVSAKLQFDHTGQLEISGGNVAHLTGFATVVAGGCSVGDGSVWEVDVFFDRATGSVLPKKELPAEYQPNEVTDNWQYFLQRDGGTLRNIEDGTVALLTARPADGTYGFQMGHTANGKNLQFGASGWFSWTKFAGSKTVAGNGVGDFNLNLDLLCSGIKNTPADCHGAEIVSFRQGTQGNGRPVRTDRSDARKALGEPQGSDAVGSFVSLGFGGELVLKFTGVVYNREGNDLAVIETSYNGPSCRIYPETAEVFASQDGINWTSIGTNCLDGEYDLGALSWAQYIKVVDISDPSRFNGSGDGFDVDGIVCLGDVVQDPGDGALREQRGIKDYFAGTTYVQNDPEGMPLGIVAEAFPNPFEGSVALDILLQNEGEVAVKVYSVMGQEVADIQPGVLSRGTHTLEWNGTDKKGSRVPAGLYIVKVVQGELNYSLKVYKSE